MVIIAGEELNRNLVAREFEANVHCLHSATTITCGYAPVVNVGTVCKTARIVAIDGMVGRRSGPKKNKKLPPSVSESLSSKLGQTSTDQSAKEASASTDTSASALANAVGGMQITQKEGEEVATNTADENAKADDHEIPNITDKDDDEEGGPSLRTGMRARLRFQFDHPQRVSVGQILVFREGRARGVGRVTAVFD